MQVAKYYGWSLKDTEEIPVNDFYDAYEYMLAQLYVDGAFDDPEDYT